MRSSPERKKRQNLSKSNSNKAVLSLSMKRTDDKAENVFKEHNSVSLTKSSDGDKIRLHGYYLHDKERIGLRHKDYYNKKRFLKKFSKDLEAIVKNNSPALCQKRAYTYLCSLE